MPAILDNLKLFQRDTMIKSLALKGVGANETLRRLQAVGLGMRRKIFLKAYRTYADIPEKADRIKFTRKDKAIGRELYTEPVVTASGKPSFMSERFAYNVEFETFNPDTGDIRKQGHYMVSKVPLKPGQIESNFIDSLTDVVDRYKLTITSYMIKEAKHKPGESWEP